MSNKIILANTIGSPYIITMGLCLSYEILIKEYKENKFSFWVTMFQMLPFILFAYFFFLLFKGIFYVMRTKQVKFKKTIPLFFFLVLVFNISTISTVSCMEKVDNEISIFLQTFHNKNYNTDFISSVYNNIGKIFQEDLLVGIGQSLQANPQNIYLYAESLLKCSVEMARFRYYMENIHEPKISPIFEYSCFLNNMYVIFSNKAIMLPENSFMSGFFTQLIRKNNILDTNFDNYDLKQWNLNYDLDSILSCKIKNTKITYNTIINQLLDQIGKPVRRYSILLYNAKLKIDIIIVEAKKELEAHISTTMSVSEKNLIPEIGKPVKVAQQTTQVISLQKEMANQATQPSTSALIIFTKAEQTENPIVMATPVVLSSDPLAGSARKIFSENLALQAQVGTPLDVPMFRSNIVRRYYSPDLKIFLEEFHQRKINQKMDFFDFNILYDRPRTGQEYYKHYLTNDLYHRARPISETEFFHSLDRLSKNHYKSSYDRRISQKMDFFEICQNRGKYLYKRYATNDPHFKCRPVSYDQCLRKLDSLSEQYLRNKAFMLG